MYDSATDERCRVRSMALADELGQVTHIFSDKTGTLTSNHMEFRRCIIGGVAYGCGETAISRALRKASGQAPLRVSHEPLPAFASCKAGVAEFINFQEEEGVPSLLRSVTQPDTHGCRARELMVVMAVNHTVLLEDGKDGRVDLCASSPDEQAFVAAAEYFGFEFIERMPEAGLVKVHDKHTGLHHTVEVLEVFPYESSRKRMSVIVRLPPRLVEVCGGGCDVRLYCKGADSVLLGLLAPGSAQSDDASMEALDALLGEWADAALRTLVWARRELPQFEQWNQRYKAAMGDPEEVRKLKAGEPNEILRLQAELECELELQGATAIEDKLQVTEEPFRAGV